MFSRFSAVLQAVGSDRQTLNTFCRARRTKAFQKGTLKGTVSVQEFEQKRNALIQCPTFQTFINRTVENDPDGMKRLLTQGHGGAAEDAFKSFVMEYDRLPSDVPERYMPTAEKRIEQQQKTQKSAIQESLALANKRRAQQAQQNQDRPVRQSSIHTHEYRDAAHSSVRGIPVFRSVARCSYAG